MDFSTSKEKVEMRKVFKKKKGTGVWFRHVGDFSSLCFETSDERLAGGNTKLYVGGAEAPLTPFVNWVGLPFGGASNLKMFS